MPLTNCIVCSKLFNAKPFNIRRGMGRFCSILCKSLGTRKRLKHKCLICGRDVEKTPSQVARSKSGKFFCGKSCQTIWRNKEFSGEKNKNWKGGFSGYRKILMKNGHLQVCSLCYVNDVRVLAAHHIDKNHKNNSKENLTWLCHNCHHLVHHDTLEERRLLNRIAKQN